MNRSFLLWFWLSTALDSWRGLRGEVRGVIELGGNQVALKEFTQVIGSTMEPELNNTPIDGMLHLAWAGKR